MIVLAVLFASDITLDSSLLIGLSLLVLGTGVSLIGWSLLQIVVLRSSDTTQAERVKQVNARIDRMERVLDRVESVVNDLRASGIVGDRRQ